MSSYKSRLYTLNRPTGLISTVSRAAGGVTITVIVDFLDIRLIILTKTLLLKTPPQPPPLRHAGAFMSFR